MNQRLLANGLLSDRIRVPLRSGGSNASITITATCSIASNNEDFGIIINEKSILYNSSTSSRVTTRAISVHQPGGGGTVTLVENVSNTVINGSGYTCGAPTMINTSSFSVVLTTIAPYTNCILEIEGMYTSGYVIITVS